MRTQPRHTASLRVVPDPVPLHDLVVRWSEAQARPCACGGTILANVLDPFDGVRAHQATDRHREWSARLFSENA